MVQEGREGAGVGQGIPVKVEFEIAKKVKRNSICKVSLQSKSVAWEPEEMVY